MEYNIWRYEWQSQGEAVYSDSQQGTDGWEKQNIESIASYVN